MTPYKWDAYQRGLDAGMSEDDLVLPHDLDCSLYDPSLRQCDCGRDEAEEIRKGER